MPDVRFSRRETHGGGKMKVRKYESMKVTNEEALTRLIILQLSAVSCLLLTANELSDARFIRQRCRFYDQRRAVGA
ncbi:MAG: hypothetical protein IJJ85_04645 [Clostridia bacterium]|nr:hypothetical protein [Clostridia bacterium]